MRTKVAHTQADKNITKILKRIRTRHDYRSLPNVKPMKRRSK